MWYILDSKFFYMPYINLYQVWRHEWFFNVGFIILISSFSELLLKIWSKEFQLRLKVSTQWLFTLATLSASQLCRLRAHHFRFFLRWSWWLFKIPKCQVTLSLRSENYSLWAYVLHLIGHISISNSGFKF